MNQTVKGGAGPTFVTGIKPFRQGGASNLNTGSQVAVHQVPPTQSKVSAALGQQPRFIRKKPQVIHSLEFSEDMKPLPVDESGEGDHSQQPHHQPIQSSLFVDDDQLRLAEPLINQSLQHDQSEGEQELQSSSHTLLISKMADEVNSKRQQLERQSQASAALTSSLDVDEQRNKPEVNQRSPDTKKNREETSSPVKDHEEEQFQMLKLQKIEELKRLLIKEKEQQKVQQLQPRASSPNAKKETNSRGNSKERGAGKAQMLSSGGQSGKKSLNLQINKEIIKSRTQHAQNMMTGQQFQTQTHQRNHFEEEQLQTLTPPKVKMNFNQNQQFSTLQTANQSPRRHEASPTIQTSQTTQMNERSQQIHFKKLQKDVEMAIRQADANEYGGLNLEELKQCMFILGYLPFLMQDRDYGELQNGYQIPIPSFRHHITTQKGMLLQEKELILNFWCILNPLNTGEIDNAVIYDVLLILIFNVQQSVQISTNYLQEYIESHYGEIGVDLESYAEGQLSKSQLSKLERYLTLNNLWQVEKLVVEFRQAHANKISFIFANKPLGSQRSQSPLANSTSPSLLFNPSDGRKYKKAIVDSHLSNLTFSPSLNQKTIELDQQVTQKLQTIKREISGGRQETYSYGTNRPVSNFIQDAANCHFSPSAMADLTQNSQSPNSIPRYDLLFYRQQIAQDKIKKAQESKLHKLLEECTFKPNTSQRNQTALANSKSFQNLQCQANQVFRDITDKIRTQRSKLLEPTISSKNLKPRDAAEARLEKELQECTFRPAINQSRTPIVKSEVPKGYHQMVNRLRKVNQEKKEIEERQQKIAIGENYDKVKLMNAKPPNFIQEQKKKRKLLMYVDVNVTPVKTGRIGIYEGDDVRELAKNFSKTFQLNQTMISLLTQQLESHLRAYKEQQGLSQIEGTVFPLSAQSVERVQHFSEFEVDRSPSQSSTPLQNSLVLLRKTARGHEHIFSEAEDSMRQNQDLGIFTYPHTSGSLPHYFQQHQPQIKINNNLVQEEHSHSDFHQREFHPMSDSASHQILEKENQSEAHTSSALPVHYNIMSSSGNEGVGLRIISKQLDKDSFSHHHHHQHQANDSFY